MSLFLCIMLSLVGCGQKETSLSKEEPSKEKVEQSQSQVEKKDSEEAGETKETNYNEEVKATEEKVEESISEVKSNPRSAYIICIDPGHQGQGNPELEPIGPGATQMKAKVATGTRGVLTGRYESEVVLEISLMLKEVLSQAGYQVVMTRETQDIDISNSQRAEVANQAQSHAFLRIHLDGSEDSSASGILGICQTSENPFNKELQPQSLALNEALVDRIVAATGAFNRGVSQRDDMSGVNWSKVPVSILELGFMTNPTEDELASNPEYQRKLCEGIKSGLDMYFQIQGDE